MGDIQTLGSSFSAVSTATIATKYSFFQIFRDLQDSQNGFLEFCKFSQNFAKFSWNFLIFGDFCWNRSKSVILACNSNEIWSELREITDNSRNSMTIAEFFWKSRKSVKIFKNLAKNAWRKMSPTQQQLVSFFPKRYIFWVLMMSFGHHKNPKDIFCTTHFLFENQSMVDSEIRNDS